MAQQFSILRLTTGLLAGFVVFVAAAPCSLASEFVDSIEVRPGATLRFLRSRPARAVGSVILFAGYDGRLDINEQGVQRLKGNFLIRSRYHFVAKGFDVAIPDAPSDHHDLLGRRATDWHARDIARLIASMRQQNKQRVWLIGTSRGTISAANAAARLGSGGADGLILTSPVTEQGGNNPGWVYDVDVTKIAIPTLVINHRDDDCRVTPGHGARKLVKKLGKTTLAEFLEVHGGPDFYTGGSCSASTPHGFKGIEVPVVEKMIAWMKSMENKLGQAPYRKN